MMDNMLFCHQYFYNNDQSGDILREVKKRVAPEVVSVSREMLNIFHMILSEEPCCYWNKVAFSTTYSELEKLFAKDPFVISGDVFESFIIGYNTYCQISEVIRDISQLNDYPAIKNRLYRIPTYISILEGCLANLYIKIILILDQSSAKDYSTANKLNQICEILRSNRLENIVSEVNVSIRNAINHGRVIFKEAGKELVFFYNIGGKEFSMTLHDFEFDKLIDQVFDTASGVLLGLCTFVNNHTGIISIDRHEKSFWAFSLFSMELSIPSIQCNNISGLDNNKQLNAEFYIERTDRQSVGFAAVSTAMMLFERYNDYDQYMVLFHNERLQGSWVRFKRDELYKASIGSISLSEALEAAIHRSDCVIFDPPEEKIDLQEIKYYRLPNHSDKNFKINNVQDASLTDRKRLKAHLFVGDVSDKQELMDIIQKAIEWLKTVKNVASPTMIVKHGNMEADSLYINVYRHDARKNKELLPKNENFVCFVDYNASGETTLNHGGIIESIWTAFYHEKIGLSDIAWREKKYSPITKKTGRNDSCPCGSGKKFKVCCMTK